MVELGCDILFLADRLGGREEVQAIVGLLTRLEDLGHGTRLICQSAVAEHGPLDLTESPGLGRRWQRPWTIRNLDLGGLASRPRIMHVLSASMADAGLEIAERWRIPYLLCVEEFPRREARLRLSRMWCRGLVATNRELSRALTHDFAIPGHCIHEIPRGLSEPESPTRPTSSGRVPVIGAAGPLNLGSGFSTFLNAARKVVDAGLDAEFLIAGQGEDEGDLRRRAERLRIAERLTFADEIPIGLSFWQVLDVYCQTSVTPTVGRPLTLAMASGVPSIATDVEGLRTLVEDGETGLIVPHGDSVALARSIVGLLQDREEAGRLGEAGRKAILRDHHPDLEAERLHAVYRGIVEAGLGPQDSGLASRTAADETTSGLEDGRVGGGRGVATFPWLGPEG
jgi:glycosyltransferase involved in cell wall biosynthesis